MLTEREKAVGPEKVLVSGYRVSAYTIPTGSTESDGTLEWDSTTLILVELDGGGKTGIGYTYGDLSTALFIRKNLIPLVAEENVFHTPRLFHKMITAIRNHGTAGIAMMAISAVDIALWDLKSKLLGLHISSLLGRVHNQVAIYGSGGFTSYTLDQIKFQLAGWVSKGMTSVKMKIGRHPDYAQRVRAAREAIGEGIALYVDANGAYFPRQAVEIASRINEYDVTWFEEPVSSDNLEGMRFVRDHVPGPVAIAAGEYGYNLPYFAAMLNAGAVDILQADITRCGGVTGFLKVASLCEAYQLPLSSHCAPALHSAVALSVRPFHRAEYFHDHVRIEELCFDGVQNPENGMVAPDTSRPGLGIAFKHSNTAKYKH